MPIVLELLGLLMIVSGGAVLLRAVAAVRADLVAKIVGVAIDPGLAAEQAQRRRGGSGRDDGPGGASGEAREVFRLKSFEEEVAALNDQMGPKDR